MRASFPTFAAVCNGVSPHMSRSRTLAPWGEQLFGDGRMQYTRHPAQNNGVRPSPSRALTSAPCESKAKTTRGVVELDRF